MVGIFVCPRFFKVIELTRLFRYLSHFIQTNYTKSLGGIDVVENEDLMRSSYYYIDVDFGMSGARKSMGNELKPKKKGRRPYTKGELNKLIDSLCHPLCEMNDGFILVDGVLNAMVEKDPPVTVKKFTKYNLPKILKQICEKSRET
jgi:hypothetical protein